MPCRQPSSSTSEGQWLGKARGSGGEGGGGRWKWRKDDVRRRGSDATSAPSSRTHCSTLSPCATHRTPRQATSWPERRAASFALVSELAPWRRTVATVVEALRPSQPHSPVLTLQATAPVPPLASSPTPPWLSDARARCCPCMLRLIDESLVPLEASRPHWPELLAAVHARLAGASAHGHGHEQATSLSRADRDDNEDQGAWLEGWIAEARACWFWRSELAQISVPTSAAG